MQPCQWKLQAICMWPGLQAAPASFSGSGLHPHGSLRQLQLPPGLSSTTEGAGCQLSCPPMLGCLVGCVSHSPMVVESNTCSVRWTGPWVEPGAQCCPGNSGSFFSSGLMSESSCLHELHISHLHVVGWFLILSRRTSGSSPQH